MGLLAWLRRPRTTLILRLVISAVFLIVVGLAALKARAYWRLSWGGGGWLALGTLPGLALLAVKSFKWRMLLLRLSPSTGFWQALKSYLGGIPLSIITPGRVGELSRILFLDDRRLLGPAGLGAVAVDKLTDLAALFWWLAAGLFLAGTPWAALAMGLAALAATPLWLWLRLAPRLTAAAPLPRAWREKLTSWLPPAETYPPACILSVVFWGVVAFGIEWVQYWALFNCFAPQAGIGFDAALAAMTLVTLAGVAQISFAGLGVREGLAAWLLWNALPPAASVLGAFGVFLVNVALPGAAGLLLKPTSPPEQRSSGNGGAGPPA